MLFLLLSVGFAGELKSAVSTVVATYAACQTAAQDIYSAQAVPRCEEALQAVQVLSKLFEGHSEETRALGPKVQVYRVNLVRALAVLRSTTAPAPITNSGVRVSAVLADTPRFGATLHFDRRSAEVQPQDMPAIQDLAAAAAAERLTLEVHGFADSKEPSALAAMRAQEVARALTAAGLPSSSLDVQSWGNSPGRSRSAKRAGRRVEVEIQQLVPGVPPLQL